MANIRQWYLNCVRWVSAHSLMSVLMVVILFPVSRCAYQVWSIYDSIPDLPESALQMVGVGSDGARFVVLDDHGYAKGTNRILVLVVFDKPMHVEQGTFQFEVKRELVDCSKRQIELQGAGFYDDQGHQSISRVYEQKPRPFELIDAETKLVCDHQDYTQSKVVGYRAALAQTQATVSQVFGH
jgi:hypothetical protein